jgi:hypothetical protein
MDMAFQMAFLRASDDGGPLLRLDQIQRQLRLGAPVAEGVATIAVADIIGTVHRDGDFDGRFRPLRPTLRKRIAEIEAAAPSSLDEPIEVVRVDRAYFVADGHKRVSIARQSGREFIDARISHVATPYELTPEVEEAMIERTAREGEFRRHSGMAEAAPEVRFALTDIDGYGELLLAVQAYSYDRNLASGRLLPMAEAARAWYDEKYLPTVARGREAIGGLVDSYTDADIFLALHRHERARWGSVCLDPVCIPDMLLAEHRHTALGERLAHRILGREPARRRPAPLLLPSVEDEDTEPAAGEP